MHFKKEVTQKKQSKVYQKQLKHIKKNNQSIQRKDI